MNGCCVDKKHGGKGCTPATCMELPDGKTCGGCRHTKYCLALGFIDNSSQTSCDFFPRRFLAPVETQVETAGGLE